MSEKSKLQYLKVLININQGVYENNPIQFKKDLLIIKKLLLLEVNQNNTQLQNLYNAMQKKLKKVC